MELEEKVKESLSKVSEFLKSHGGDVEFVELTDDNVVKVTLKGACGSCPMAMQTLKGSVETFLKKELPEIKAVEPA